MYRNLLKKFFVSLTALFPLLVFFAIKMGYSLKNLAFILLFALCLSFYMHAGNRQRITFLMGAVPLILASIVSEKFIFFYPVMMNFAFFSIFAFSLQQEETMIEIIAKKMKYDTSSDRVKEYTRNATIAWSIFLFINTIASAITVFLEENIWTLYNGFISYVLIGIFFICEFIVRKVKCL